MRIFVFGTRGFPDIQGGVEQHCENLYPLIASDKYLITVFRRRPYISTNSRKFEDITFIDLPSTRIPGLEAFLHSFLCTIVCLFKRPDIIHIHNIGPGIFLPLLKLAGLKVVLTYHSPNYEHNKWSLIAKYFLKFGEILSTKFADTVIFVSMFQMKKLGNKSNFVHINNGVKILPTLDNYDYIKNLGLERRKYILAVGRLVEEKGFEILIGSYSKIKQRGISLVIAGATDHETAYSVKLSNLAKLHNVVMAGLVRGEQLQQLYSHARLFVLTSFNEGQPLTLLEAMSFHLPVVVSDIQANLQINLPSNNYFSVGNEQSLVEKINLQLESQFETIKYDLTQYNWDQVAVQTKEVFQKLMK